MSDKSKGTKANSEKKPYDFGGLTEFNLEEIESEVLNDSVYLDVFAGSDLAFKEDVKPTPAMLDNVLKLDTVSYNYKTEEFSEKNFSDIEQIGLIANEVEEIFPHVVKKDDKGFRHINYGMLTPVLIKSVQELSSQLQEQQQIIEKLSKRLEELEK